MFLNALGGAEALAGGAEEHFAGKGACRSSILCRRRPAASVRPRRLLGMLAEELEVQ